MSALVAMKPDATKHDPRPQYLRDLIDRSGHTIRSAAEQIGVGDRMLRYYLAGERKVHGRMVPCLADYPTQFALEALAASSR